MKIDAGSQVKRIVCLTVLLLLLCQFVPLCFAISADEASEAIRRAEQDLGSAFVSVAQAEVAGADVSELLAKLEVAGGFLAEAHSALRVGDYENAFSFAAACSDAVEGVVANAARLKLDAEKAKGELLVLASIGSGVGLVLLLVFGFLGWRLLKKWYFKRFFDMKPEIGGAD